MKHLAIALGALLVAFCGMDDAKAQTQVQPYYGSPPSVSGGPVNKQAVDTTHGLPVNCILGCSGGGGGLSVQDGATFTAGTSNFTPGGGEYNSSPTALTSGTQGTFSLNQYRALNVDTPTTNNNLYNALTAASPGLAATACTTNSYSTGTTVPIGLDLNGAICVDPGQYAFTTGGATTALSLSTILNYPYPVNSVGAAVPVNASSGNVAAGVAAASLPAAASKFTYMSGFQFTSSGSTVGLPVICTITGIATTKSYIVTSIAGVLLANAPLIVQFNPPLQSTAVNTAIVASCPSLGTGNTNAVMTADGYQL